MRGILVDAGPLVALLDRSDDHHRLVAETFDTVFEPLLTVWPVLTEAMYLLGFSWAAQRALWEMVETGVLSVAHLGDGDVPSMKRLMEKYRDLPMDLADAALVRVAEREGLRRVFTLDHRDFGLYRIARKGRFTLLPADRR